MNGADSLTTPQRSTAPEDAASAASSQEPSAVHGIMAVLGWVPRLVLLHLGWVVLVLAGGVVAGLAPATATMLRILRRDPAAGAAGRLRGVLFMYRAEFLPANRAAGPFMLISLMAGVNIALGILGALPEWFFPAGFLAALLFGAVSTLSSFHAVVIHVLAPDTPAPTVWTGALAGPFLLPVPTVSWVITLGAMVVIGAIIQPVAWLLSGGIMIAVTGAVLARPWQVRLDAARAGSGSR